MSIGLQIKLEKVAEDETTATYDYYVQSGDGGMIVPSPTGQRGRVRLEKTSGAVALLVECPDDTGSALANRAASALRKRWKNKLFPDKLQWIG